MSEKLNWRIAQWFPDLKSDLIEQLTFYHSELLRFNRALNLISRPSESAADELHFADSLLALRGIESLAQAEVVHDLGSGNGHPGLVCAILYPHISVHLVESDLRKGEFLKHIAARLKLLGTKVLSKRIEDLPAESIQIALARGLASIDKTCSLCQHALKSGGIVYHLKSANWTAELEAADSGNRQIWLNSLQHEYQLPVSGVSRAVVASLKN